MKESEGEGGRQGERKEREREREREREGKEREGKEISLQRKKTFFSAIKGEKNLTTNVVVHNIGIGQRFCGLQIRCGREESGVHFFKRLSLKPNLLVTSVSFVNSLSHLVVGKVKHNNVGLFNFKNLNSEYDCHLL